MSYAAAAVGAVHGNWLNMLLQHGNILRHFHDHEIQLKVSSFSLILKKFLLVSL